MAAAERLEERVSRGGNHGRDRQKEGKFQGRGPRHAGNLTARNRRHGARRSGNTPEKIWQKPIQRACPRLMFSIFQVWMWPPPADGPAASDFAFMASTIHMMTPPISNDQPMMVRLSKCFPITLVSRNDGIAVTTKATVTNPRGWVSGVRSPRSPRGKVDRKVAMRLRK